MFSFSKHHNFEIKKKSHKSKILGIGPISNFDVYLCALQYK